MRAALGVVRVIDDPEANLDTLVRMAHEAADRGADLVLFPEAVLTGLINDDRPAHDLSLGQPLPGPATGRLAAVAEARGLWAAFGLFEREDGPGGQDRLYDTAVLIDDRGELRLVYRRINPQWHWPDSPPDVYGEGESVATVVTPWGQAAFLICGDLFDDAVVAQLHEAAPDWVLFPFARCFVGGGTDQQRWDEEELPNYVQRVRKIGVPALMVNYLADPATMPEDSSFGGAFAVSGAGEVLARYPLGREGLLIVDLDLSDLSRGGDD